MKRIVHLVLAVHECEVNLARLHFWYAAKSDTIPWTTPVDLVPFVFQIHLWESMEI